MKLLFTLHLVLLPLIALCQSKEADEYYNKGKELYQSQQAHLAIPYFEKSDSLEKRQLPKTSPDYYRSELALTYCWADLANYNVQIGNAAEAIRIQTLVVNSRKKILGKDDGRYQYAKQTLESYKYLFSNKAEEVDPYSKGMYLLKNHQAYLAISYFQKSDSIDKATHNPNSPEYYRSELALADCWCEHSAYNSWVYNYDEAIRYQNLALQSRRKILGDWHPLCAQSLYYLSSFQKDIGNLPEAVTYGTAAAEILKRNMEKRPLDFAEVLNSLAQVQYKMGDANTAIKMQTDVAKVIKDVCGENSGQYATVLNNLANYYCGFGNIDEAIRIGNESLEIRKKLFGEDHEDYAQSLTGLAVFYNIKGDVGNAIRLDSIAMEIYKKTKNYYNPDYALVVSNLAMFYANDGNYNEAIRYATISQNMRKRTVGEGSPDYAQSLFQLGVYSLNVNDYETAGAYLTQYSEHIRSTIKKNFSLMTYKERTDFWNLYENSLREGLPWAAYRLSAAPSYSGRSAEFAYDAQLFSKGLLLNAELEVSKLVNQSGDTSLANLYYKIRNDRSTLDKIIQTSSGKNIEAMDSLWSVIENEERALVQRSKELGDYTQHLSVSWHDVQKKLQDNDLAVEFVNFKDNTAKEMVYAALVLKKGMASPQFVKLFTTDDFFDIKTNEYYKTTNLYNLVWNPLAKYLEGAKNVYFSPSGRLHTIGIEYLPDGDGKIFAEKYDAYRLSSTRELAIGHTINPDKKAATYGGIKYDFSNEDWENLMEERHKDLLNDTLHTIAFRNTSFVADKVRGSGMVYLDGTKDESTAIADLLRIAKYDVSAMTDAAATEESIKLLSGTGLKILHIGTHGFYESSADMENAGLKFYSVVQQSDEDRSLSCSGLLFAGANSALDPKRCNEIPEGADDGILTAKEISRLDFKGLDLVVLSACQTGLGEITGDGVFGLQRGFKKAGAQTIIMSLWKVADESTQLLMIEFFKNLIIGRSKRAAFVAAQKIVRAKYPNPLHWAAFVMVDGMD